ncbi:hypothetical protein G5C51_27495 [Streptomyces sp. A7024]|uniref:Uncharacterized protein n=1 Tax=Streptomyces coryli TaxID=1128680 RepID=A0A6G4U6A6_9ACTN|nr:hypothetical protein [Streptomyces coryli]NGN67633.1 hypothetical protein [Streptomyces coryli]
MAAVVVAAGAAVGVPMVGDMRAEERCDKILDRFAKKAAAARRYSDHLVAEFYRVPAECTGRAAERGMLGPKGTWKPADAR